MAHAEAYKDDGTPEEQSRRTFMANAVVVLGGVIGLTITVPLVMSLLPPAESGADTWSTLTPEQAAALDKATAGSPIKVTFDLRENNAYFGTTDTDQFVWATRVSDADMRKARPDLFDGTAKTDIPYPVVNMGFAIFSPLCPHLGCRYAYNDAQKKFLCPCHGSVYSELGVHEAGPALRGLDPLPLRNFSGKVQVTWIEYAPNVPGHIVMKVG